MSEEISKKTRRLEDGDIVEKERLIKDDKRYIIFYSFDEDEDTSGEEETS